MLVSVVVSTRNRVSLLARCLESLRLQTYREREIIVVDNDPTIENARDTAERFGAHYVIEPRRGLSRARNRGAALARGEIVAFTDDDVVADERWLESLVREFDNPRVMAAAGQVLSTEGAASVWLIAQPERRLFTRDEPQWFEIANFGGIGNGANMAFRRSALSPFNHHLGLGTLIAGCEEHDAFFRLLDAGHAITSTPAAIVHHSAAPHAMRRTIHARLASALYLLFLFITQPRHRSRVARYGLEALMGKRRTWRKSAFPRVS
jgi:glycosyltransferase involved in cell wall biosynthesis